jgi:hypothetical protein
LLRARTLVTVSHTGENANRIRLTSSVLSRMLITLATVTTAAAQRDD